MTSVGVKTRGMRNATTPGVPVARIPTAKSMHGLNTIGTASAKVRRDCELLLLLLLLFSLSRVSD